jgi:hypothetical protein
MGTKTQRKRPPHHLTLIVCWFARRETKAAQENAPPGSPLPATSLV